MTSTQLLSTSPCRLTDFNGTLTLGDFFKTAKLRFEERPGTGTTIELRSCERDLTNEVNLLYFDTTHNVVSDFYMLKVEDLNIRYGFIFAISTRVK